MRGAPTKLTLAQARYVHRIGKLLARIPTEVEMATRFGVSRVTIRAYKKDAFRKNHQ
jgi:DNA-binding CsgD family transcriptional regulator